MDFIRELCWIPTLGGGFGMSPSDAERIPLADMDDWREWMRNRRSAEAAAFKGR